MIHRQRSRMQKNTTNLGWCPKNSYLIIFDAPYFRFNFKILLSKLKNFEIVRSKASNQIQNSFQFHSVLDKIFVQLIIYFIHVMISLINFVPSIFPWQQNEKNNKKKMRNYNVGLNRRMSQFLSTNFYEFKIF